MSIVELVREKLIESIDAKTLASSSHIFKE